jgi:hypothetical protein
VNRGRLLERFATLPALQPASAAQLGLLPFLSASIHRLAPRQTRAEIGGESSTS